MNIFLGVLWLLLLSTLWYFTRSKAGEQHPCRGHWCCSVASQAGCTHEQCIWHSLRWSMTTSMLWDTLCLIIPSVRAHTRALNPALSISAFQISGVLIRFQISAFASAIIASKEGKWRGGMILTIGMEHAMESINGTARMNSIIVLDFADSASYCSQKDIGGEQLIKRERRRGKR